MQQCLYRSIEELPLVMCVDDLMPVLGIGKGTAYELIRCGQIRSIKVGRRIRIPREAVAAFIENAAN